MMMLAETCIIVGTMDGYGHLSIAEREDIMVRWKGHEGVSQIARELHRDKSTISREIRRNGWQGPAGRRYRASAAQRKADMMWQHLLEQIYERIRPASLNSTGLM